MENFKSYFFNPLPLYVAIVFFSLQFFSALIISPSLNIFLSSCLTLWFFTTVQTLVIKSNQINLRTNLFQKLILKYNSYDIQRNEIIFYGKGGAKTIVLDEGFEFSTIVITSKQEVKIERNADEIFERIKKTLHFLNLKHEALKGTSK